MKTNSSVFSARLVGCYALILVFFFLGVVRVGVLTADRDLAAAADRQDRYRMPLYTCRGEIVDTEGRPLTDTAYERRCILLPDERGMAAAEALTDEKTRGETLAVLREGRPATVPLAEDALLPVGATEYYRPIRYATASCCHLLGYADGAGHGVSGIEKGMEDYLFSDSETAAYFLRTATGKILSDSEVTVEEGHRGDTVKLTVDRAIQRAAEETMSEVDRGAALVIEAASGRIRALVSRPVYCGEYAASALRASDSPLVNRALSLYNVGSVFKLLIGTALLDGGIDPAETVTCRGALSVGGRVFHCHEEAGHGAVGLRDALAESCNCYFYTKTGTLGAAPILNAARLCGMDRAVTVPGYAETAAGKLPNEPLTAAALCNLAIGQGDLMLTPFHLAALYATAVNGGWYRSPTLVEEVCGRESPYGAVGALHEVTSAATASRLRDDLVYALSHGTGLRAAPDAAVTAGGKTATAQTGWLKEEKSVLNGWYCGFVTTARASYVICIVREDVTSGATDCAPLFARLAEGIARVG